MSSYIQGVLGSDEQLLYSARVSVWSMLPLLLIGLLLLPFYGIGLLFWAAAYIRYQTTELGITNKKIIAKFGFIKRDTIELLLPKVESIQVRQSILGRLLNYGSIVVSGAGNPQAPIPGIAAPLQFRKSFADVQDKSRA